MDAKPIVTVVKSVPVHSVFYQAHLVGNALVINSAALPYMPVKPRFADLNRKLRGDDGASDNATSQDLWAESRKRRRIDIVGKSGCNDLVLPSALSVSGSSDDALLSGVANSL